MLTVTAYWNAIKQMFEGYILSKHNWVCVWGPLFSVKVFQGNFLDKLEQKHNTLKSDRWRQVLHFSMSDRHDDMFLKFSPLFGLFNLP